MENVTIPVTPAKPVTPPVVIDPRLWIGIPAFAKIDVPFVCSMIRALGALPNVIGDLQFYAGDSLVNRARNNLVSMFLDGKVMPWEIGKDAAGKPIVEDRLVKVEWMLFLDSDLIFNPQDIKTLYDLGVAKGPGVYAGTYPLKTIHPKVVFNMLPNVKVSDDGTVPVREAGTGFMLVHRSVYENMQKAYPENDFSTDQGDAKGGGIMRHDWFQVGVKRDQNNLNPRFLSEDWFFCEKYRDMGGMILMQTKICANHIGTINFPLNPAEVIEVAEIYKKSMLVNAERKAAKIAEAA